MQKKLKIENLRKMRGKKIYLKFKRYFVSLTKFFCDPKYYDAIFQYITYLEIHYEKIHGSLHGIISVCVT
jgi:hypothetical protein